MWLPSVSQSYLSCSRKHAHDIRTSFPQRTVNKCCVTLKHSVVAQSSSEGLIPKAVEVLHLRHVHSLLSNFSFLPSSFPSHFLHQRFEHRRGMMIIREPPHADQFASVSLAQSETASSSKAQSSRYASTAFAIHCKCEAPHGSPWCKRVSRNYALCPLHLGGKWPSNPPSAELPTLSANYWHSERFIGGMSSNYMYLLRCIPRSRQREQEDPFVMLW